MDSYGYNELLKELETKLNNIEKIIRPDILKEELERIKTAELDLNLWADSKKAGNLGKLKRKTFIVSKRINTKDVEKLL